MLKRLNGEAKEKKDKAQRDDVAHYAAKLRIAKEKVREKREVKNEKALIVTEELGQMEIWSSVSDDEEALKPTNGCFMAKMEIWSSVPGTFYFQIS